MIPPPQHFHVLPLPTLLHTSYSSTAEASCRTNLSSLYYLQMQLGKSLSSSSPSSSSPSSSSPSSSSSLLLCLPTPLTLVCGGESDHPAFGLPASLSLRLTSSSITPAGSVHKSRGDSVVRMWVQLKRWCVSCVWVLQRGHSGDEFDLASTLCKYDLRK